MGPMTDQHRNPIGAAHSAAPRPHPRSELTE